MPIDTLIAAAVSVFLVMVTTVLFYEIMRAVWNCLPKLTIAPRYRILIVMMAIFTGHTIAVWLYGIAYWLMIEFANIGSLSGEFEQGFLSYIYFSAATYSSLGIGDIFPKGALRFVAGVEVLNGLVLIAWSASFTYLTMQKFWDLHPRKTKN